LEKTSKIIKSNHQPNTAMPAKPYTYAKPFTYAKPITIQAAPL